jgi:hypothetical protein
MDQAPLKVFETEKVIGAYQPLLASVRNPFLAISSRQIFDSSNLVLLAY